MSPCEYRAYLRGMIHAAQGALAEAMELESVQPDQPCTDCGKKSVVLPTDEYELPPMQGVKNG